MIQIRIAEDRRMLSSNKIQRSV